MNGKRKAKRPTEGLPTTITARLDGELKKIFTRLEGEVSARGLGHFLSSISKVKVYLEESTYIILRIPKTELPALSPRLKEVAALLLEGLPRKVMAQRLGISPRTVDEHVQRLYVKFHVDGRIALLRKLLLLSEVEPALISLS